MKFARKRKRITIYILIGLLILASYVVLAPVDESQCSLHKEMAKCGGKSLHAIPQDLPISIRTLDLSNNSLANIDWIQLHSYKKISILIMKSCNVHAVPVGAFKKLHQLEYVDLSYNRLSHVNSQIFTFNTKLVEVLLNGNYLRLESESPFIISFSIVSLELRNCGIRQISSVTFREMKKLKYLDLSMNKINVLDSGTFHYNVFMELKIDPVEEISTELGKVCANGAVVGYVVGDKHENWCQTKKSPGIESTTAYVNTLEESHMSFFPVTVIYVALTLGSVALAATLYLYWCRRRPRSEASTTAEATVFFNSDDGNSKMSNVYKRGDQV